MNENISLRTFSTITRMELHNMLVDKVEELHMDCGLKLDASIAEHAVKKLVEILSTKYKSWCWGDFEAVCKIGITGGYGRETFKINFQTIVTWLKKAENLRGAGYAAKSVAESEQYKRDDMQSDYATNGRNWGPVMYLRFHHGLKFDTPIALKNALEKGEVSDFALTGLRTKYPYVLTVGYPFKTKKKEEFA